jgi:hypothetical protein
MSADAQEPQQERIVEGEAGNPSNETADVAPRFRSKNIAVALKALLRAQRRPHRPRRGDCEGQTKRNLSSDA